MLSRIPVASQPLPSRSRIAAFLKATKLTRRYQRHSDLLAPKSLSEGTPHDEWKLGARGTLPVDWVGNVSLVTIIDADVPVAFRAPEHSRATKHTGAEMHWHA
jgi:hypothetical protein